MSMVMLVNSSDDLNNWSTYILENPAEKEQVLKFLEDECEDPARHVIVLDSSNGHYFLESKDYDMITLDEMITDLDRDLV
jgi:hypothetical protein